MYRLVGVLILFGCNLAYSQNFKLRFVNTEQGLTNPYIYSITQDKTGFLWAATSTGIARYDGKEIKTFLTDIEDNFITSTFLDTKLNLWIGHSQGSVTVYSNGKFREVIKSTTGSTITCFSEDENGHIWCATKNEGLIRISNGSKIKHYKYFMNGEAINALLITGKRLYIGTDNGLKIYGLNTFNELVRLKNSDWLMNKKVHCIAPSSRGIMIGTEESAYLLNERDIRYNRIPVSRLQKDFASNVQHIFEDHKNNIWISTFDNGLFKMSGNINRVGLKNFNESNGLETNSIRNAFEDREGNIWIGTYGLGLACIVEEKFSYYDLKDKNLKNNIFSLGIKENEKWLGLENGLLYVDETGEEYFLGKKEGLPDDKITSLHVINETVLAGTEHSGVYRGTKSRNFRKINLGKNELHNCINAITSNNNKIWIATKGGLVELSKDFVPERTITTDEGLPHNNIHHLLVDSKGLLWMGFPIGKIARLSNGTIENFDVSLNETILNISCLAEDKKGNIWLGTNGNGVFIFDEKESRCISATDGLRSNYCYLLSCDEAGNIWVGHRGGISVINSQDHSVIRFDRKTGFDGDCNFNSVAFDNHQNIWFGTSNGVIKYDPDRDLRQKTPPVVSITGLKISDKDHDPASASLDLPFKNYRIRIEFKAVSLKQNEDITYQYKLEGHDNEWIETPLHHAFFTGLAPGTYKFLVKARKDKLLESAPVSLTFVIDKPLWKKSWFIASVLLFTILSIYYIVKLRERRLKDFQEYLKKLLDEKTFEMSKQKEELARKNKDITDSINYAKRIQDAILPDQEQIRKAFPESFVFYQPRDIVSGDFYWFDQVENRYVLICADATGHGVPGAFITMIGSTLIRDIYSKHSNCDPSEILQMLHKEFKTVMKQHGKAEQINDSMDISIAELDLETGQLKVASSMRPVFLVKENIIHHIKGDRALNAQNNKFENKEFTLQKGDALYLFTDGITDQFGGPQGKKIKTSGLKELLTSISEKPMDEQHAIIKHHFYDWKKDHDQLDDVLLIGVRF